MIEHDPTTNFCRRMNVDLESHGHLILQEDRQCLTPLMPQPVADAVSLQRMEALQVQKRGGIFVDSRVTRAHCLDIAGRRGNHFRIGGVGFLHHFTNSNRRHDWRRKLIRQHIA
ncbi:hypothetical protein D3C81_1652090 [compost metagenome]